MKPLLALLLATLLAGAARADWDNRRPGGRVIFFSEPNFRGAAVVCGVGDEFRDLHELMFDDGTVANDRISSIRIEGRVRVGVFSGRKFGGDRLELTESVADLRRLLRSADGRNTWNDSISSLAVEWRERQPGERPGRGPRPLDPDKFVPAVFKELLGRAPTAAELRRFRIGILDEDWTEDMVRAEIMRGSEYRNREADRIIRQAYRDLLGRDPDPTGERNFRKRIVQDGWSERKVRDAIRDSAEYKRLKRQGRNPPDQDYLNGGGNRGRRDTAPEGTEDAKQE